MKDFLAFLGRTKMWLLIVSIFVIFIIPLLINCAYKTAACCSWFVTEWDANDALSLYGSMLVFVGTVFLGAVTLFQNKKLHDEVKAQNERAEKERKALLHRPHYVIENVETKLGFSLSDAMGVWTGTVSKNISPYQATVICIKLRNVGDGLAFNIRRCYEPQRKCGEYGNEILLTTKAETPDSKRLNIEFCHSDLSGTGLRLKDGISFISFMYENDLGTNYIQTIPVVIIDANDNFTCTVHPADPAVAVFDDPEAK